MYKIMYFRVMGKNKKNRGGKGKGAKKKKGVCLKPSHYLNKQQNSRKSLYLDQIHDNMKSDAVMKVLDQPLDEDKAGQGQNYCVHCE